MTRPGHDEWGLRLAEVYAQRATCLRRSVGCVLMNVRHQDIGAGYNGRAAGLPHCNHVEMKGHNYEQVGQDPAVQRPKHMVPFYPNACSGARSASGTNLDGCEAIHAEQNALLKCRDVYQIKTAYITVSPCVTCVKLLLNTSCRRIVFRATYTHDQEARRLWLGDNIDNNHEWLCLPG